MDFNNVRDEAKTWLSSTNSALTLSQADKDTNRLCFVLPDNAMSFYIECPKEGESNDWHVGSDSEAMVPRLMEVQDSLDSSRKRGICEVLKLATASLEKNGSDNDEEDDDDDDGGDDFYYGDDAGDLQDINVTPDTRKDEQEDSALDFFTGEGSPAAVQRLLSDLKHLKRDSKDYGIEGCPKNDNLFLWEVKLTNIPTDTKLGKDLHAYSKTFKREPVVSLEVKFPVDYPMSPPFVRVIRPRFRFLTGHVTVGGSICMEMLTKSGWRPTNDIEGIMIQVRCEILSDPNASLDPNPDRAYDEAEARSAFERMVIRYGWNK